MLPLRAHPIAKVGQLLILFRVAGLVVRYLVQSTGSAGERLELFLPAASAHVGALLIIVSSLLLLAKRAPTIRRPLVVASCVLCAVLMIAGQGDFTVSAITGAPLTPTVFRTFRGIRVVKSNEFLEPLKANLAPVAAGVVFLAGVLVWMASVIRGDRVADRARDRSWTRLIACLCAGIALLWLPTLVTWPVPPPPIEAAFAGEYLGLDQTRLRGSEQEAIRDLRELLGLPPHMAWLSDEYPLVYGPAEWVRLKPDATGTTAMTSGGRYDTIPLEPDTAGTIAMAAGRNQDVRLDQDTPGSSRGDRPDIVVVMIESLRAEDLALVTGARESASPNMDALAARGVVFPAFTSNGFPSAPSVLSFHCSAWPHRRKEIITDFADRRFDCIPSRLREAGYETMYVGADPNFDNQDRWLPQWYSTVIDLVARGVAATDHNIVTGTIDEIRRHDASSPAKPLFAFVSTYSTHYPFRLPADAGEPALPSSASLSDRYRQALRYADREVGALLSFLDARRRREQTVTIVVGDHGFYTDLRRTSGLPENDNIWTAAIVTGPPDLVGPPRRIEGPASHADMLPTILALVGDGRPSASLGADLFGAPRGGGRSAVAIRAGGVRFDRDGYSVLVDARTPNVFATGVAFPGLLRAGARPSIDRARVMRLVGQVTTWSYLVEKNRVWNGSFLQVGRPFQGRR
jgi:hypothetical protein